MDEDNILTVSSMDAIDEWSNPYDSIINESMDLVLLDRFINNERFNDNQHELS